jgi:hypothetical protein
VSHGSYLSFFGGLKGFLIYFVSHHSYLCGVEVRHLLLGYCLLSLDGEDSRITRFLQESLHTNPFRKIPDYNSRQFTFSNNISPNLLGLGDFPQKT